MKNIGLLIILFLSSSSMVYGSDINKALSVASYNGYTEVVKYLESFK